MGVKNVKVSCAVDGQNTGVGDCWNDIGIPRGILFVPRGKLYSTATAAGLLALIQADLLADLPNGRIYPVQGIEETTDNTTAPNEQTFSGTGRKIITNENDYDLTFQWIDGGFCLLHALRQSNRRTCAFFIIDSYGQLIGTDGGGENITGIVGYNYTAPFTWAVGTAAVAGYKTRLEFSPDQVNENIAIVDFSEDGGLGVLSRLNGLFNVHISQAAAPTITTVTVKAVVSGCDNEDLYDSYADALAVVGAWKVIDTANNGAVTVTGVTKSAGTHGWVLTFATQTGKTLKVSLAGPTELDALDVSGYASDALTQIIP